MASLERANVASSLCLLKKLVPPAVALFLGAGTQAGAQATPNDPEHHLTLRADQPQQAAHFGWTMAMGKLGDLADTNDDVLICAIHEDDPPTGTADWIDIGAAYPFEDADLTPHFFARLLPSTPPGDELTLGQLGVVIGDVRGGLKNLAFVGTIGRHGRYTFCSPPEFVRRMGAVEIYDVGLQGTPVNKIVPPPDPPDCAPVNARHFGHDIAIADVDGDGINDLIVGALGSDSGLGRVYIFFGHVGFALTPTASWVALKPPAGTGLDGGFGVAVAAADLDGDLKAEVIVGAHERPTGAGRAYIISGSWIAGLARESVHQMLDSPATEHQELINPREPQVDDYGWRVYADGDVGSDANPMVTVMDGLTDVWIHSAQADAPAAADAGALFIYFNNNDGVIGAPFVNNTLGAPYLELQSPTPESTARFGRSAARVTWLRSDGSTADYVLVGEPNSTENGYLDAGRVWLYALPLKTTSQAWPAPLREPTLDGPGHRFGAMIVAGDYLNDGAYPGQQFLVSSRQKDVGTVLKAGEVYSYRPLVQPP